MGKKKAEEKKKKLEEAKAKKAAAEKTTREQQAAEEEEKVKELDVALQKELQKEKKSLEKDVADLENELLRESQMATDSGTKETGKTKPRSQSRGRNSEKTSDTVQPEDVIILETQEEVITRGRKDEK